MRWQEVVGVLYLVSGGGITILGVRVVASHWLHCRTTEPGRAPPLPAWTGVVLAAVGAVMLLAWSRVMAMLVASA